MVGLFSLETLRKEMTGIIFCVLLSGPGSVFHPNGDTRQQGAERGRGGVIADPGERIMGI